MAKQREKESVQVTTTLSQRVSLLSYKSSLHIHKRIVSNPLENEPKIWSVGVNKNQVTLKHGKRYLALEEEMFN